jgi:hypothetical protein
MLRLSLFVLFWLGSMFLRMEGMIGSGIFIRIGGCSVFGGTVDIGGLWLSTAVCAVAIMRTF